MVIDNLTLTDLIGKGSFGDVFLTTKKESSTFYATKVLDLSAIKGDDFAKDYIDKEMSILMDVNHPNIIELDIFSYGILQWRNFRKIFRKISRR